MARRFGSDLHSAGTADQCVAPIDLVAGIVVTRDRVRIALRTAVLRRRIGMSDRPEKDEPRDPAMFTFDMPPTFRRRGAATGLVLDGHHQVELTADRLKRLCRRPHLWSEQRQVLGFN